MIGHKDGGINASVTKVQQWIKALRYMAARACRQVWLISFLYLQESPYKSICGRRRQYYYARQSRCLCMGRVCVTRKITTIQQGRVGVCLSVCAGKFTISYRQRAYYYHAYSIFLNSYIIIIIISFIITFNMKRRLENKTAYLKQKENLLD